MQPATLKREMARKGGSSMPVRLDLDAIEIAKVAASIRGETLTAYASGVLREVATTEVDAFAKARAKKSEQTTPPRRRTEVTHNEPSPERPARQLRRISYEFSQLSEYAHSGRT